MKHYEAASPASRKRVPGEIEEGDCEEITEMRGRHAQIRQRPNAAKQQGPTSSKRQPATERNYRVVAISVYADQAESVDRAARELVEAGFVGASRSFVIQSAIQKLREDLEGKSREEILKYFLERQVKRPLSKVSSKSRPADASTAP